VITLTVRVRETQPDDVVSFGGQSVKVAAVDAPHGPEQRLATVWIHDGLGGLSDLNLLPDAQITVQREVA